MQRIKIKGIKRDSWFRKDYLPFRIKDDEQVNLDDVRAVFDDIEVEFHFIIIAYLSTFIVYFGR